ncbi:MAG: AMP-binding protein [Actinomycetota bacterium]
MSDVTSAPTAHEDHFCRDRLPPADQWPTLTGVDGYPDLLNAADFLLAAVRAGDEGAGERTAFIRGGDAWSYADLDDRVARIAAVLTSATADGGLALVPGNRVLLRGFNSPELAAAILACFHAGLVAVPTMPLLRAGELDRVAERASCSVVLTDSRLRAEVDAMAHEAHVVAWGDGGSFDAAVAAATPAAAVATSAVDVAMLLFTSGTTGVPKAAAHLHRDIAAICDTVGADVYQLSPTDVVTGTPPLAFAYGFGAFCAFPLRAGAATVLIETPSPDALLDAIETHRATVVFTAPTAYRALLAQVEGRDLSSLRYGASAGETLPAPTYEAFLAATDVPLLDGIGSTELLHVFLSNRLDAARPGATGIDVAGYVNRVVDDDGNEVATGEIGHLEVQGPTGCLYLDDERQKTYVRNGWNRTGDLYSRDADGWFYYQSRADDLIVTAGYNVAGPEVEAALLSHPAVAECAVIGVPDPERGQVVKAYVVPTADAGEPDELRRQLQAHVKDTIAPYKYPRSIEFRGELPKTGTGKIQRFVLRETAADGVSS